MDCRLRVTDGTPSRRRYGLRNRKNPRVPPRETEAEDMPPDVVKGTSLHTAPARSESVRCRTKPGAAGQESVQADGRLARLQPKSDLAVAGWRFLEQQEGEQGIEDRQAPRLGEGLPETSPHPVQENLHPRAREESLRIPRIGGLKGVPLLGVQILESEHGTSSPTLESTLLPVPIREEPGQGRQQKAPQASFLHLGRIERLIVQQLHEEALREVLGIMNPIPAPTQECVDRIPVESAQLLQRNLTHRSAFPNPQNEGPVGGGKLHTPTWRIGRGGTGGGHGDRGNRRQDP